MKLGNLADVEPWKAGDAVPQGNYACRIDEANEGASKGGHPQIEISWTVLTGDFAGAEIRDWIVVTEASRGKVVALLQALGMAIPGGDFELKVAELVGKQAQVIVRNEPGFKDPTRMFPRVQGHKALSEPVSNGNGSSSRDDDIPF